MQETSKVPQYELKQRVYQLQDSLKNLDIDGALIVGNVNLYYYAGSCQSGHLLIPAEGEPVYMVKKNYQRAREESMLDDIRPQEDFDSVIKTVEEVLGSNVILGLELDILPAKLFLKYKEKLPALQIEDVAGEINLKRAIKSEFESEKLKDAASIHQKMLNSVPGLLYPGITELELASQIEQILRKNGHQGKVRMRGFNQEMFFGHVVAGENLNYSSFVNTPVSGKGLSPAFPQNAGHKFIEKNEPVMIDYVTAKDGYMVDQTRIFCMGELPGEMEEAYETALKIHEEIARVARPGVTWELLCDMAFKVAEEEGFEDNFMGYYEKVPFVGHGVGLELDELPILAKGFNRPLEAGMVFALEPKMFFPGTGMVGLEDTYIITDYGIEKITSFPEVIYYL